MKRLAWQHAAYRLLWVMLAPALSVWLWWRGRKEPAYRQRILERWGKIAIVPSNFGCLWVHAASVGEVNAAQPLLEQLLQRWPEHSIVVSTQTPTGAAALVSRWGNRLRHVYAPMDTAWATKRFLDRLQPQGLILIEREVWPEWLHQCSQHVIPVALVNARLTEASCQQYQRWMGWMRPSWASLQVAAADPSSAQRLIGLGVRPSAACVTGNLKFDIAPPTAHSARVTPPAGRQLIVAGSTHADDEDTWMSVWPAIFDKHPTALLVLVPRHPQRFSEVAQSLAKQALPFSRTSEESAVQKNTSILLVDEMGQLSHWYRCAHICFIGGTFARVGGHNPLEAVNAGQAIVFGPHTDNAKTLFDDIVSQGAGTCLTTRDALRETVLQWLDHPDQLREKKCAASEWANQHRGATQRTLQALSPWLNGVDPQALVNVAHTRNGAHTCWFNPQEMPNATDSDFLPDTHITQTPLATGSGRGRALKVLRQQKHLVIRHYFRGGLMAKLSKDRFSSEPAHRSRAMREFALLRLMTSWRLPVPLPAGAHHRRTATGYTADIAIRWIPEALNLVQKLARAPLSDNQWHAVGKAIRRLHDHQVFHSDLNAHNLMLDGNDKAWIVDFDKCLLKPGDDWKHDNLSRLQRSFIKEARKCPDSHWQASGWNKLIQAYESK